MGWTESTAMFHNKDGSVNRKAECDYYFEGGLNRGFYKLIASAMKGSTYYAAAMPLYEYVKNPDGTETKQPVPENERKVYGFVFLTYVKKGRFGYKPMSEDMGPGESACPRSVLKHLSPTDNKWAQEWRERCEKNFSLERLGKLPIGTKIRFTKGGRTITLQKHAAAYQFKKPFWMNTDEFSYFSKKNIPGNYEIVK